MRIGFGYDVHRLVEGRKLIIGGVQIEHTHGLLGHSDADVLIHAICDALLGAAGLRDIGHYFPDINPHIDAMKNVLAKVMNIPSADIGIKATTNEQIGFVGRKEGITAYAVALIKKVSIKNF